jgi:hypothetical protein
MLSAGVLARSSGLIRQEEIGLQALLANRFGRCYAQPTLPAANAA